MKRMLLILLTAVVVSAIAQETPEAKQQVLRTELEKIRREYKALTQRKQKIASQASDAATRRELEEIQLVLQELTQSEDRYVSLLKKIQADWDTTEGVSNICPTHKRKMSVIRAPISYGLTMTFLGNVPPEIRQREFPFALDYWRGGCVVRPYTKAKIYSCPDCQRAEKQWRNTHPK